LVFYKKANLDAPLLDDVRDDQELSESDGEEGDDEDPEDAGSLSRTL
jgi:hypothetical protein